MNAKDRKSERVLREYNLREQSENLAAMWRGDDRSRQSLRELVKDLNKAILESVIRGAGICPLDSEVENIYRLLTDDEVSTAQRTEDEAKLEREGIDLNEIRSPIVSHQAIHSYLRDHQGVRLPESDESSRVTQGSEKIQRNPYLSNFYLERLPTLNGVRICGTDELSDV